MISNSIPTKDSLYGGGGYVSSLLSGILEIITKLIVRGSSVFHGIATFLFPPVCSVAPTSDNQLSNKKYVDDEISGGSLLGKANTWTNTNLFNLLVTFVLPPICTTAPDSDSELANKKYVDDEVSGSSLLAKANTWTNTNLFNDVVTFAVLPQCSVVPVSNNDLVNRLYANVIPKDNTWTGENKFNDKVTIDNNRGMPQTTSNVSITTDNMAVSCFGALTMTSAATLSLHGTAKSTLSAGVPGAGSDITLLSTTILVDAPTSVTIAGGGATNIGEPGAGVVSLFGASCDILTTGNLALEATAGNVSILSSGTFGVDCDLTLTLLSATTVDIEGLDEIILTSLDITLVGNFGLTGGMEVVGDIDFTGGLEVTGAVLIVGVVTSASITGQIEAAVGALDADLQPQITANAAAAATAASAAAAAAGVAAGAATLAAANAASIGVLDSKVINTNGEGVIQTGKVKFYRKQIPRNHASIHMSESYGVSALKFSSYPCFFEEHIKGEKYIHSNHDVSSDRTIKCDHFAPHAGTSMYVGKEQGGGRASYIQMTAPTVFEAAAGAAPISEIYPTLDDHLATKEYVDDEIGGVTTLQHGYDNTGASDPDILVNSTLGGITFQQDALAAVGTVLQIRDSGGTATTSFNGDGIIHTKGLQVSNGAWEDPDAGAIFGVQQNTIADTDVNGTISGESVYHQMVLAKNRHFYFSAGVTYNANFYIGSKGGSTQPNMILTLSRGIGLKISSGTDTSTFTDTLRVVGTASTSGDVTVGGDLDVTGTTSFTGTISGDVATFSGLVTGIAPSVDLNFATKKYVDDEIGDVTTLQHGYDNTDASDPDILVDSSLETITFQQDALAAVSTVLQIRDSGGTATMSFDGDGTMVTVGDVNGASPAEMALLSGVTTNINTNFSSLWVTKANLASPDFSGSMTFSGTLNTITTSEFGYLDGVTSNIQTQLNAAVLLNTANTFTEINTFEKIVKIYDNNWLDPQPGTLFSVQQHTTSDTDVNGTIGGEAVYHQIAIAKVRPWYFSTGVTNNTVLYIGNKGGPSAGTDPDFMIAIKRGVGMKISPAGGGTDTSSFTDALRVVGTVSTTGLCQFPDVRIYNDTYTITQAGVIFGIQNSDVLDTTVNGTIGGESVYHQIGMGARGFYISQGVANGNMYMGFQGGATPDPDMMLTFQQNTGIKISSDGSDTSTFTETLKVIGTIASTGNVNGASPTEMGYLSGVTSNLQTQLSLQGGYDNTAASTSDIILNTAQRRILFQMNGSGDNSNPVLSICDNTANPTATIYADGTVRAEALYLDGLPVLSIGTGVSGTFITGLYMVEYGNTSTVDSHSHSFTSYRPIYYSVAHMNNIYDQDHTSGTTAYSKQDPNISVAGEWGDYGNQNDKDWYFLVPKHVGLIAFENANYSGTVRINFKNDTNGVKIVRATSGNREKISSIYVYYWYTSAIGTLITGGDT